MKDERHARCLQLRSHRKRSVESELNVQNSQGQARYIGKLHRLCQARGMGDDFTVSFTNDTLNVEGRGEFILDHENTMTAKWHTNFLRYATVHEKVLPRTQQFLYWQLPLI